MALPGLLGLLASVFKAPIPANSWLKYSCEIEIQNESGVVIGTTLPSEPLVTQGGSSHWNVLSPKLPAIVQADSPFPPMAGILNAAQQDSDKTGGSEVFAQQRAAPILYVFLVGEALRAGFPIPIPELTSINGAVPVSCNRADVGEGFRQRVVGQTSVPMYYASWRLRYVLVGELPPTIPVPPNPLYS